MMPSSLPFLSVLIPCKNEAHVIQSCLDSLLAIDYPLDKIEVLIGNDDSKDDSLSVIEDWMTHATLNTRCIDIGASPTNLIYKARVLDVLVSEAKGEVYYFLDADSTVNNQIDFKGLLDSNFEGFCYLGNVATGQSFIQRLQSLDWAMFHTLNTLASPFMGVQAVMGNNLLVSQQVYSQIGGFSSLGPSMVEDLQLLKAVRNEHAVLAEFNPQSINLTRAENSVSKLYSQRLRWLEGWSFLKTSTRISLVVFIPLLCFMLGVYPFLLVVVYSLLFVLALKTNSILPDKISFWDVLSYPVLALVFYLFLPFKYLVAEKKWK